MPSKTNDGRNEVALEENKSPSLATNFLNSEEQYRTNFSNLEKAPPIEEPILTSTPPSLEFIINKE